jgi:hypothetical protein
MYISHLGWSGDVSHADNRLIQALLNVQIARIVVARARPNCVYVPVLQDMAQGIKTWEQPKNSPWSYSYNNTLLHVTWLYSYNY